MLIIIIPIVLVSFFEAIIGFYQSFIVYGISHSQGAHGTFVNRNHYAGLLEITIPLILGFAFSFNKHWHKGLKDTLHSIKYSNDIFKQIPVILLVLFLLLALFLSKSRMGILSIFISLFFFYSNLNLFGNKYKNILWFLMISIIFFILLIFLIDINPILERFRNINSSQRVLVWKDCIYIIKDFPLFGSGLGTFKYIYPLYKENLKIAVDYHYAHNDYIHLLVETGLLGFSCLMAGLIILFKDAMKFLKYNTQTRDSSVRSQACLGKKLMGQVLVGCKRAYLPHPPVYLKRATSNFTCRNFPEDFCTNTVCIHLSKKARAAVVLLFWFKKGRSNCLIVLDCLIIRKLV